MFSEKYCQAHPLYLNQYLNLNALADYNATKWICQVCYNSQPKKNSLAYPEIVQRFMNGKEWLVNNYKYSLASLYQEFQELFIGEEEFYLKLNVIFQKLMSNPISTSDYERLQVIESYLCNQSQMYLLSDDQLISLINCEEFIFENTDLKEILKQLNTQQDSKLKQLVRKISIIVSEPVLQKYEYEVNQKIVEVLPCNNRILVEECKKQKEQGDLKMIDLNGQKIEDISSKFFKYLESAISLDGMFVLIKSSIKSKKIQVFTSFNNNKHLLTQNIAKLENNSKIQFIQTNKSQFLININKQVYHLDTKGKKIISRSQNPGSKFVYDNCAKVYMIYSDKRLTLIKIYNKQVVTSILSDQNLVDCVLLCNQNVCVQHDDQIYSVLYDKTCTRDQKLVFDRLLSNHVNFMTTSKDLHYLIVMRTDNILKIFDHTCLLLKSIFVRASEPIDSISVSQDMDSLILKSKQFKLNQIPLVIKLNLVDDY